MRCEHCGGGDLGVTDSRPSGETIRRRRKCAGCGRRCTTYEVRVPRSPGADEDDRLGRVERSTETVRDFLLLEGAHRDLVVRLVDVLSKHREGTRR